MKKILLVEDDKFTSDIYVQILSGEFKVDTAEDGESAYKIITGTEYDLILLDMYLPIMDGKKLFEKLENDFPGKYKKKIVFITNDDSEETVKYFKELKIDYLIKSTVNPQQFFDKIKGYFTP